MAKFQFNGESFASIEKVRDYIRENKRNYNTSYYKDIDNKPIWIIEDGKRIKVAGYSVFEGITYKSKFKHLFE